MKLRDYLERNELIKADGTPSIGKISLNRWCETNGLGYATVLRAYQEESPVSPKNAGAISRATGGIVTVMELLDPRGEAGAS